MMSAPAAPERDSFFNHVSDTGLFVDQTRRMTHLDEDEYKQFVHDFFHTEPSIYGHRIFQLSATVFLALKHTVKEPEPASHMRRPPPSGMEPLPEVRPDVPTLEFGSENEKRLVFNLVFSTLKYQRFLEDMLEDCQFFGIYPEFKEDTSLVMVMLCDFKTRKFQRRLPKPHEELVTYLLQIETALYTCKTKLNAALARSRIKARVLSIDHLLPDSVRQNDKIGSDMHVYCWVNQLKMSLEQVVARLKTDGFVEAASEQKLSGKTYRNDNQCTDMLCFPYDYRDEIEVHPLMEEGVLIIQDKSSCVGPHSVKSLINEGDDILHVNVGSGLTTAHLASLTHNSDTVVFTAGVVTDKQQKAVLHNIASTGTKSRVRLCFEDFLDIDHTDERFKHIKVVLITAECSRSGVANPVNFIVSEAEDMSILRDLSLGYTDENKLGDMVVKHNSTLKHALRFPRVQAIVYCTRSLLEAENESVVTRAIEYVNMVQQKKTPFRIAPPVLPLSDRDIEMENPLNGKYLRYPPSNFMSGCFIATITREADDPKEAAKDILAKAAARGIITGVPVHKEEKSNKSKSKSGRKRDKDKTKGKRKGSPKGSPRRSKSIPGKDGGGGAAVPGAVSAPALPGPPRPSHVHVRSRGPQAYATRMTIPTTSPLLDTHGHLHDGFEALMRGHTVRGKQPPMEGGARTPTPTVTPTPSLTTNCMRSQLSPPSPHKSLLVTPGPAAAVPLHTTLFQFTDSSTGASASSPYLTTPRAPAPSPDSQSAHMLGLTITHPATTKHRDSPLLQHQPPYSHSNGASANKLSKREPLSEFPLPVTKPHTPPHQRVLQHPTPFRHQRPPARRIQYEANEDGHNVKVIHLTLPTMMPAYGKPKPKPKENLELSLTPLSKNTLKTRINNWVNESSDL